MKAQLRVALGALTSLAGVWTLADIPIINPLAMIALGWTLLGLGLAILAPALLDLLEPER